MKPCLLDSGFLYALIDETDRHNRSVKYSLEQIFEDIILPVPAISEVAHFVGKYLGPIALANFVGNLENMELILLDPTDRDYRRASKIIRKYHDQKIDFVDACIFAVAERLNITKILTVDRRHFSMFRPAHCDAFEIVP